MATFEPAELMGAITTALERELTAKLRNGIVFWLDKDRAYSDLALQLRARHQRGEFVAPVVSYQGSFLELFLELDAHFDGLDPSPLLVHAPGYSDQSIRETPLLEAYHAGTRFECRLDTLVREVATGKVAPGEVERFVKSDFTLGEAEAWLMEQQSLSCSEMGERLRQYQPKSLLRELLEGELLQELQSSPSDLADYIHRHCGLDREFLERVAPGHMLGPQLLVDAWIDWCLCVEYVFDLSREPVDTTLQRLKKLTGPLEACSRNLAQFLRQFFPQQYTVWASRTEHVFEAELAGGTPEELGKIDTFSREDSRLLEATVQALEEGRWNQAYQWAEFRVKGNSIWLQTDPRRRQEWTLVLQAAELGRAIQAQSEPLRGAKSLEDVVELYCKEVYLVDSLHRQFEQSRLKLLTPDLVHYQVLSGAVQQVRRTYFQWMNRLNGAFHQLCDQQGYLPQAHLRQRHLYEQVVHPKILRLNEHLQKNKVKMAYFLVDALRFEMAAELRQQLDQSGAKTFLQARLAELPSITSVGMNALAPVHEQGRLKVKGDFEGFRVGASGYVVSGPAERLRAMSDHSLETLPGGRQSPVGISLAELLDHSSAHLDKLVKKTPLVVVHSSEIDGAGEHDLGPATFDIWLGQLLSGIKRLHKAGVQEFVVVSDHGFIFLDETQPSLKLRASDRRYHFSQVPITDEEMTSVSSSSLCLEGGPEYLVFPRGNATFQGAGRSARSYDHGGSTLQERTIPVLEVSYRTVLSQKDPVTYKIETRALPNLLGHCRLNVRLSARDQNQQLGFEAPEIPVGLRVVDRTGVDLIIKEVQGAKLSHQLVVLSNNPEWTEVLFVLQGAADRAKIEIYHPEGMAIESHVVPEYFAVAAIHQTVGHSEEIQIPVSWCDSIANEGHRAVLLEIQQQGYINEDRIAQLLGGTRGYRKFVAALEGYRNLLPFQIVTTRGDNQQRLVKENNK